MKQHKADSIILIVLSIVLTGWTAALAWQQISQYFGF